MRISLFNHSHDTQHGLACFKKLIGHGVTVWNDDVQEVEILANRLNHTEALVPIRERTKTQAPLLDRLDKLKLMQGFRSGFRFMQRLRGVAL